MAYYVYVLQSSIIDRYYVGQTEDLKGRLIRHNRGYEKSTSPYVPWELIWLDTKVSRAEAMTLERKLKNLSKARLAEFMARYIEGRKAASSWG